VPDVQREIRKHRGRSSGVSVRRFRSTIVPGGAPGAAWTPAGLPGVVRRHLAHHLGYRFRETCVRENVVVRTRYRCRMEPVPVARVMLARARSAVARWCSTARSGAGSRRRGLGRSCPRPGCDGGGHRGHDHRGTGLVVGGRFGGVGAVGSGRDRAYTTWFDSIAKRRRGREVGRPRFKSRKDNRQSLRFDPQRVLDPVAGRVVSGEDGPGAVVPGPVLGTVVGQDRRGAAGPLLRRRRGRVASAPLPPVEREEGVDVGIARLASVATSDGAGLGIPNPERRARRLWTLRRREPGESPPRRRREEPGREAPQGRCPARQDPRAGTITTSRHWAWSARMTRSTWRTSHIVASSEAADWRG
jgi:hypothetical protein